MSPRPGDDGAPGSNLTKIRNSLLAGLALAGVFAAALTAAFAIYPVTASRLAAVPLAAGPVTQGRLVARPVGLEHCGGDLRRAVRLTRRARRRLTGQLQSWADAGLIAVSKPAPPPACGLR